MSEGNMHANMPDKWFTTVEYDGREYPVPATGRDENLNAMLLDIPGQQDVVTPRLLHDQRFYKWAMAFLMQDGDLDVPGGRYGTSTRTCAEVAIIMSLIMQYHNGESITYYQLDSDMGIVVNSSDDVAYMLYEYAELVVGDMLFEFDIEDWLSEDEIAECKERHETEYGE